MEKWPELLYELRALVGATKEISAEIKKSNELLDGLLTEIHQKKIREWKGE